MTLLFHFTGKWKLALVYTLFFLITSYGMAAAQRYAVSSNKANIRSGPGTKNDVLWEVEKYHPLEVLKKKDPWYYFRDFEGDKGWIHKKLLVKNISTVITKKDKCNVRSGPGTTHEILFSTEKGIPFKVLKRKGKWLRVLHSDGDKGWIYESLVW